MKNYLLLPLLLLTFSVNAHDIRLAIFEISEPATGSHLLLNATIDKEDMEKSLLKTDTDYQKASPAEQKKKIIAYLTKNFQITIGEECAGMSDFQLSYEEDFIKIKARIEAPAEPVKQIRIHNTCLIDYTEGHSNIIKCKLYGKLRSFRLTEDRVSTIVEY